MKNVKLNVHFHFIVVVGKYLIFIYEAFLISLVFFVLAGVGVSEIECC